MGGIVGQALAMIFLALGAVVGGVASVIAFRMTRRKPLCIFSGFGAFVAGAVAGTLGGLLGNQLGCETHQDEIVFLLMGGGSIGGGALAGFLTALVAKRLPLEKQQAD